MSSGFEIFANQMQNDLSLIADFVANPRKVMKRFKLTASEMEAVISRDSSAIAILTGNDLMAQGVLSGAHTPTCRPSLTRYD